MKLVLLTAAWLGGVFLGLETDVRPAAVYLFMGAALALGAAVYVSRLSLFPVILAAFLLAGLWRTDFFQTEPRTSGHPTTAGGHRAGHGRGRPGVRDPSASF